MSKGTHKATDARLGALLDEASRRGSCFGPRNRNDRAALSRRVEKGLVVSPYPGVYASPSFWNSLSHKPEQQERAILLGIAMLHPSWVFCHVSAAIIHGLNVPYRMHGAIHVANLNGSSSRQSKQVVRHRIRRSQIEWFGGIALTSPLETTLECLCDSGFREGLSIADSAARLLGLSGSELRDKLSDLGKGTPGIQRALSIAQCADPLSESGGESIARAAIIRFGYVLPRLQIWIPNPLDQKHPFRADAIWILLDGTIIICEVDGIEKRINPEMTGGLALARVFAKERQREALLTAVGAKVMRVSFGDAWDGQKLCQLLDAYGVPKANSLEGLAMRREGSAMMGGVPAPNGAVIRNGRLKFER